MDGIDQPPAEIVYRKADGNGSIYTLHLQMIYKWLII